MDASSSADVTGNFECIICYELAKLPIVPLCNHLYCWPSLFQWLRIHSHCHECPVCKANAQDEQLIPMYGTGKSNCDPRSRSLPITNRPMEQRPQQEGAMPMSAPRFGHLLSILFGALQAIFNFLVHGFHNATVYGAPHCSFHGAYVHGFQNYHAAPVEWKLDALKIIYVLVIIFLLIIT